MSYKKLIISIVTTKIRAIARKMNNLIFQIFRSIEIKKAIVLILSPLLFYVLGCQPRAEGGQGELKVGDHFWKGIEFDNARFEPQLSSTIHPARTYWLKRSEQIAPKFDSFETHWEKQGETCSFTNNASSAECTICDYCTLPPGSTCPNDNQMSFGGEYLSVITDQGFTRTEENETLYSFRYLPSDATSACTVNNGNNPAPIITPEKSGSFRFLSPDPSGVRINSEHNGEVKVQVVNPGANSARKTAYPLQKRVIDGSDYWGWKDSGGAIWNENFSSSLRVTEVRLFRGVCADGAAEGLECKVPSGRVPVKASRILFLPNFQQSISQTPGEAQHRCYSGASGSGNDGSFINLSRCRERFDSTTVTSKFATPTYESSPAAFDEKLTWLVQFNTNEGADADLSTPTNDPMNSRPNLIIEFTIEAN